MPKEKSVRAAKGKAAKEVTGGKKKKGMHPRAFVFRILTNIW